MNLFELKNYKLQIQPEAYALTPFKVLWDRDKSKDKAKALFELAFVYFSSDYKSDFISELDINARRKEVAKSLGDIKYKPDKEVEEAVKFYCSKQETIATKLLEKSYVAVDKLMKFYDAVDLTTLTEKGSPVYNAKQLSDTLKGTGEIIKSLRSLEEVVKSDKEMNINRLRGGREKGIYEDK